MLNNFGGSLAKTVATLYPNVPLKVNLFSAGECDGSCVYFFLSIILMDSQKIEEKHYIGGKLAQELIRY